MSALEVTSLRKRLTQQTITGDQWLVALTVQTQAAEHTVRDMHNACQEDGQRIQWLGVYVRDSSQIHT